MSTVEEEDQTWKNRAHKIYKYVKKPTMPYINDYTYLYKLGYCDNPLNNPDLPGLDYGDYDYSEYPEERVWYWKRL